jgi:hypothetical protein
MNTQQTLFPIFSAHDELKDYITDKWLSIRVIHTEGMILIHIEPSDTIPDDVDVEQFLWEQADSYYDDVQEWFSQCYPTLSVRLTERDKDWFILSVTEQ